MTIKILKFICLAIIMFAAGFVFDCSAIPAPSNPLVVIFTPNLLFSEINFLPGNSATSSAEVFNNSGEEKQIVIEAIEFVNGELSTGAKFGDGFNLTIKEGITTHFNGTLTQFFSEGEYPLSNLGNNNSTLYEFFVIFNQANENEYQGKNLSFDIILGFKGEDEDGVGNNGNGGGVIPSGLTIINESTVSECAATIINWTTSYFSTSRVIYSTSPEQFDLSAGEPNYGYDHASMEDTNKVTGHSVELTGLDENTTYYYRCVSHASPATIGYEKNFTTCDCVPGDEEVIVLGEEGAPELTISKTVNADFANPGDIVIYEVKIANIGNMAAYNAALIDTLPTEFIFVDGGSNSKIWQIGDIEPNQTKVVEYEALISEIATTGTYANVAQISADNCGLISSSVNVSIELAPTGFSVKEFMILISALIALSALAVILRKKYLR